MKKLKKIICFIICLTVTSSCKKDVRISNPNIIDCGTNAELPSWATTLTDNQLVGDWKIVQVTSRRGNGSIQYSDTIYYPNQVLKLAAGGNGTLNVSIPINWTYNTMQNNFPKMTLIKINTLFSFPVNFINNDSTATYIQSNPNAYFTSYPHQRFFVSYAKGENGNWEYGSISFERQ